MILVIGNGIHCFSIKLYSLPGLSIVEMAKVWPFMPKVTFDYSSKATVCAFIYKL